MVWWQIIISLDLLTGKLVNGCRKYVCNSHGRLEFKTSWKGWIGQWLPFEKGVVVYHPRAGAVYFKWVWARMVKTCFIRNQLPMTNGWWFAQPPTAKDHLE